MKVLLKILKKNVRNSIVCFMSTILTAIILFVFLGVKELVLGTMSMEERVRSQLGIAIQTYMYILLFIGLILISYTVSNYSRIRIKDYGMFMVFGEEKKDIIRMIILEYGIICGIS
jgi:predicted lysophospholipase L1 biosynthesis ABC-type transport system permease subunit